MRRQVAAFHTEEFGFSPRRAPPQCRRPPTEWRFYAAGARNTIGNLSHAHRPDYYSGTPLTADQLAMAAKLARQRCEERGSTARFAWFAT